MPVNKRVIGTLSTGDFPSRPMTGVDAKSSNAVIVDVRDAITASVQVSVATTSGSGSRSTWSVRVSNDGENFAAFPTGEVFVSAGGISDVLDVTPYRFIRISNASADGGGLSSYTTETVNLSVCVQN
jgi:hypothetical protein